MMTPLDEAVLAASKDQSLAGEFYSLFLRSNIFVPTFNVPENEGARRASGDESFNPVIIDNQGQHTLILFDTVERLTDYADREIGYVAMPGHAILESMPEGISWALNHTTEYFKEFVPEEIAYLKSQLQSAKPVSHTVPAGTNVLIGSPAKIPPGLKEALSETMARNSEVVSARLGWVHIGTDESPHFALAVSTAGVDEMTKAAIANDLGVASRGNLDQGQSIDILVDAQGVIYESIIEQVEPFYQRRPS